MTYSDMSLSMIMSYISFPFIFCFLLSLFILRPDILKSFFKAKK